MSYTIEDIARELGMSKTTVSRAISGKGRISEATRTKVNEYIKKVNYTPNAVARSLARSQTYNVGLIFPTDSSVVTSPYFQTLMTGVCARAMQDEYDVLIILADNDDISALEHAVNNKKVDAIIASRAERGSRVISFLKKSNIPYIVMGNPQDEDVLYIDHDNEGASARLIESLIDKGVTRMALIGGGDNINVTKSRLDGFCQGFKNKGLEPQEGLIFLNMHRSERMEAVVLGAIKEGAQCIVCMDDMLCNSVLLTLHKNGISIPEDVMLCSFYDSSLLSNSKPSITSLFFDAKKLGAEGFDLLLRKLRKEEVASRVLSDFNIQMRDSTD